MKNAIPVVLCIVLSACSLAKLDPSDLPSRDSDSDSDTIGDSVEVGDDSSSDLEDDGDSDCTNWYLDEDGDDYGVTDEVICADAPPEGYVFNSGDCCDSNEFVFPSQDTYFGTPYYCPMESFDYNCSGALERVWDTADHTTRSCGSSCVDSGWNPSYPACGEEASYGTCYPDGPRCGVNIHWSGVMRCR